MHMKKPLLHRLPNRQYPASLKSQHGVVLLISLIVLVAMTLSALALIRSVNTTNLIAGNLSFRESAVQAGERSTETVLANWLTPNATGTALHNHSAANGYRALRADPAAGTSWDAFWNTALAAQSTTGAMDAAGMTVAYVVHRMCDGVGAPHLVNCSKSPTATNVGGSQSAGGISPITSSQVYYRITTRITGPRNTVAYIQTVLAL
jgi:type IV pilus assembly protein PilX